MSLRGWRTASGASSEWVEAQAEAVDMVDHATREPYEKGLTM